MMELLGNIPHRMTKEGQFSSHFFNKNGGLRNIRKLERWPLLDVLLKKYGLENDEAELFSSFLLPMLEFEPDDRASAHDCLKHPWLVITQRDKEETCKKEHNWYMEFLSNHRDNAGETSNDEYEHHVFEKDQETEDDKIEEADEESESQTPRMRGHLQLPRGDDD
eukprot:UN28692